MADPLTEARQRLARAEAVRTGFQRRRDEARARVERLRREADDLDQQIVEAASEGIEVDAEIAAASALIRELERAHEREWDAALRLASDVRHALMRHQFRVQDEAELDDAIAAAFDATNLSAARQVVLSGDAGRIDFLTRAGVGVELKVAGSVSAVVRQLHRYSLAPEIRALVLVTTRAQHRRLAHQIVLRVPLLVHHLSGLA